MKKCNRCHETKTLEEFQKRAKNKDGHTEMCKLCKRAYDNAHYKANPERRKYIRSNSDARHKEVIAWVRNFLLANPCVDCGESDIVVLQFDHQRDKIANVSTMVRKNSLENVQAEVAKCVVRCANCHMRKTAKDFGWWKTIG